MVDIGLRTRVLRTLLEFDQEMLTRKSAAAGAIGELADVMGQLCSLILNENGEDIFRECLTNISSRIEKTARDSGAAPKILNRVGSLN